MKKIFFAGVDEAGRGPLAGPVVGAAVLMEKRKIDFYSKKIKLFSQKNNFFYDSKKISSKKREAIFNWLKNQKEIEFSFSWAQPRTIEKINILRATFLVWRRALNKLTKKPNLVFVDGNLTIPRLKLKQIAIIKGDQSNFLIALASIVAKVIRDQMMKKFAKKYPQYQFETHKGYATKKHLEILKKIGPCDLHRRTFKKIKKQDLG